MVVSGGVVSGGVVPGGVVPGGVVPGGVTTVSPLTVISEVAALLPRWFDTVSVTTYVPSSAYVCTGFCSVEVAPSPKSQSQVVGDQVLVSSNRYVRVPEPISETVNDATGSEYPHLFEFASIGTQEPFLHLNRVYPTHLSPRCSLSGFVHGLFIVT